MHKTLPAFLFIALFVSAAAWAQTQPAPQTLPYQQNFDALAPAATTYPAGWQGWALSGSPSGSFITCWCSGIKAAGRGSSAANRHRLLHHQRCL